MPDQLEPDVDERLRRAFDPDASAAARVAAEAIARPWRALYGRRLAFAAGAGMLCVAAVLALWKSPPPAEPELAVPFLTASCIDGVVILPLPDGSVSATSGEARDDRPPEGRGIILVEGVLR
jgi:hypothetical protein